MWYTYYAVDLHDSETEDIRHITEHDIHRIGFSPVFGFMQPLSIAAFGKNLFGLRALNLVFVMAFGFLHAEFGKKWFVRLPTVCLALFCLLIAVKTPLSRSKLSGQWKAYTSYSEDLNRLLTDKTGRVFTSYDFSWALEDYPKLFMEATIFENLESYDRTKQLFEKYDVKYALVDERSRLRMDRGDELSPGKIWYRHWNRILKENYEQIGTVYNKYYRHNRGLPPKDPRGFKTEVWCRIEQ